MKNWRETERASAAAILGLALLFPAGAVPQGKSKTIILEPIETKAPIAIRPVEIIGITPTHGTGLPKTKVPANVQSATSEDLERSQSLDLSDYMDRNLG